MNQNEMRKRLNATNFHSLSLGWPLEKTFGDKSDAQTNCRNDNSPFKRRHFVESAIRQQ